MYVPIRGVDARVALVGLLSLGVWQATGLSETVWAADQYGAVPGQVRAIKVLPDRAPDSSSLKSIVETVTRGCKTNDARCIAIYNYMLLTHYHHASPDISCTLRAINSYGWALCGSLRTLMGNLWHEAGYRWRPTSWPGHNQGEVFYDGRWHFYDIFLKFYAWAPDPDAPGGKTVASLDDMKANPRDLVLDAFVMDGERRVPYPKDNQFKRYGKTINWQAQPVLTCGDALADLPACIRKHEKGGIVEPSAPSQSTTIPYTAEVNLAPGATLTNTWDPMAGVFSFGANKKPPAHSCGNFKDTRNDPGVGLVWEPYFDPQTRQARSYGSGILTFAPDFSSDAILKSFAAADNVKYDQGALVPAAAGKPASVVVDLASPYLLCQAACMTQGADSVQVIGGRSYTGDSVDLTDAVRGKVAAQVKITFKQALRALRLEAIVQNNPGALPYLSPGKNVVSVSVADLQALGANRLAITYAYRIGSRSLSFEQLYDEGKEVARGHNARWSDTVICVQKIYTAKDLPARFEIDCPTPKGKYPVYPRMVFLRREVLSPGQKPADLPSPPSDPAAGPDETLATLPNPFLTGSLPPPPEGPELPKKTVVIPAKRVSFVSKTGETAQHHYLRWPKDASEIWVMLVDFGEVQLPGAAELAGGKLVFYVDRSSEKAPSQVAAVRLAAPFELGKPYALDNLGASAGTTIVKKGNGADAPPVTPVRYEINVGPTLRAWAGGAKNHGLALRIQPNRAVDNGWNVRLALADDKPVELEISTFVDATRKQ